VYPLTHVQNRYHMEAIRDHLKRVVNSPLLDFDFSPSPKDQDEVDFATGLAPKQKSMRQAKVWQSGVSNLSQGQKLTNVLNSLAQIPLWIIGGYRFMTKFNFSHEMVSLEILQIQLSNLAPKALLEDWASHIAELPQLKSLVLDTCNLAPSDLPKLTSVMDETRHFLALDLNNNNVNDEVWLNLAILEKTQRVFVENLRCINISHTPVTNVGLQVISRICPVLEVSRGVTL